jgi:hypothetical protein
MYDRRTIAGLAMRRHLVPFQRTTSALPATAQALTRYGCASA